MITQIKEEWITALTDGSYTQGQFTLQTVEGSFCCLGVLCDLYRKETGRGTWKEAEARLIKNDENGVLTAVDEVVRELVLENDDVGVIYCTVREPVSVTTWAGINSFNAGTVAQMNDGGKTFAEIAQYIKDNF